MNQAHFNHRQARFLAALFAVGLVWIFTVAAIIPARPNQETASPEWVRTAEGWQRPTWREARPFEPGLHPILPALGIALLSAFWLIAFSDFERSRRATVAAGQIPAPHTRSTQTHALVLNRRTDGSTRSS
jgi:hypothetical protein